jgi:hypothetical protein
LDGKVDETHYQNASIQKIFELIEEDSITPEERYDLFEESHRREEIIGECKIIAKNMLAKGFDLKTIVELTGLTLAEIEKS